MPFVFQDTISSGAKLTRHTTAPNRAPAEQRQTSQDPPDVKLNMQGCAMEGKAVLHAPLHRCQPKRMHASAVAHERVPQWHLHL